MSNNFQKNLGPKYKANTVPKNTGKPGFCKNTVPYRTGIKFLIPLGPAREALNEQKLQELRNCPQGVHPHENEMKQQCFTHMKLLGLKIYFS